MWRSAAGDDRIVGCAATRWRCDWCRAHHRPGDIEGLAIRLHVMHAKEPRAPLERHKVNRDRSNDARCRYGFAGELADESLAGCADQHRIPKGDDAPEAGDHRPSSLTALP